MSNIRCLLFEDALAKKKCLRVRKFRLGGLLKYEKVDFVPQAEIDKVKNANFESEKINIFKIVWTKFLPTYPALTARGRETTPYTRSVFFWFKSFNLGIGFVIGVRKRKIQEK